MAVYGGDIFYLDQAHHVTRLSLLAPDRLLLELYARQMYALCACVALRFRYRLALVTSRWLAPKTLLDNMAARVADVDPDVADQLRLVIDTIDDSEETAVESLEIAPVADSDLHEIVRRKGRKSSVMKNAETEIPPDLNGVDVNARQRDNVVQTSGNDVIKRGNSEPALASMSPEQSWESDSRIELQNCVERKIVGGVDVSPYPSRRPSITRDVIGFPPAGEDDVISSAPAGHNDVIIPVPTERFDVISISPADREGVICTAPPRQDDVIRSAPAGRNDVIEPLIWQPSTDKHRSCE